MTDDKHWMDDAACQDTYLNFYTNDDTEKAQAKRLCMECPVRKQCLQYALDNTERFGIWGGVDERELRKDQSVDAEGKPYKHKTGPIRCPYCGNHSTKFLKVREHKRTRTHIECSNCGLKWWTKFVVNKKQNNF